jgi:cbb3-type cytochrome oxidase subunit 3
MNPLIMTLFFMPELQFSAMVYVAIQLALGFGFVLLVKRVYSPANQQRFQEESRIPMNDDTPEEKQFFHHHQGRG